MAEPPSYEDQFAALYQRAYSVAFRLLGAPGSAEDIAQETLARAYVRWSKIADEPTGWCVTVALNLTMDALRTAERDRTRQRQLIALDSPASKDAYVAERLDLYGALRALPKRQRQIVGLRYIGDLSEQQVATALDVSLGTVKSQSSRGLDALRAHLTVTPDPTRSSHV